MGQESSRFAQAPRPASPLRARPRAPAAPAAAAAAVAMAAPAAATAAHSNVEPPLVEVEGHPLGRAAALLCCACQAGAGAVALLPGAPGGAGARRVFIPCDGEASREHPELYADLWALCAAAGGSPLLLPDAALDARFEALPSVAAGAVRFFASAPIVAPDGRRAGAICVCAPSPRPAVDAATYHLLQSFAEEAAGDLFAAAAAAGADTAVNTTAADKAAAVMAAAAADDIAADMAAADDDVAGDASDAGGAGAAAAALDLVPFLSELGDSAPSMLLLPPARQSAADCAAAAAAAAAAARALAPASAAPLGASGWPVFARAAAGADCATDCGTAYGADDDGAGALTSSDISGSTLTASELAAQAPAGGAGSCLGRASLAGSSFTWGTPSVSSAPGCPPSPWPPRRGNASGAAGGSGSGPAACASDGGGAPPRLRTPRTSLERALPQLRLGTCIGAGNFGRVFTGTYFGTSVAVKVIQAGPAQAGASGAGGNGSGPESGPGLEAELSASLSHPNLVRTLAWKQAAPGETWLIMEYADGGTLQEAVESGCMTHGPAGPAGGDLNLLSVVATAREIASGMAYLHACSVVHGDLTAANVLLAGRPRTGRDGRGFVAQVADFGLSRVVGGPDSRAHSTSVGAVTAAAPEVLADGCVSAAGDVYSYGVLLWQMCVGRRPWDGVSPAAVIHAVCVEGRQLEFGPGDAVPDCLQVLALGCMARNPSDRPSFEEILEVLQPIELLSAA